MPTSAHAAGSESEIELETTLSERRTLCADRLGCALSSIVGQLAAMSEVELVILSGS